MKRKKLIHKLKSKRSCSFWIGPWADKELHYLGILGSGRPPIIKSKEGLLYHDFHFEWNHSDLPDLYGHVIFKASTNEIQLVFRESWDSPSRPVIGSILSRHGVKAHRVEDRPMTTGYSIWILEGLNSNNIINTFEALYEFKDTMKRTQRTRTVRI